MKKEKGKTSPALIEYRTITSIADTTKALDECQIRFKANKIGYRARIRGYLGATAELCERIIKSEKEWKRPAKSEFWETCSGERPTLDDHADCVRFVTRYAEGAISREAAQTASKHAAIIEYLLDLGTKPVDMLAYLSKRGQGMNATYVKAAQQGQDTDGQDDQDNNGAKRPSGAKTGKSSKAGTDEEDSTRKQSGGHFKLIDISQHLVLKVDDPDELDYLLQQRRAKIKIEKIGTEPGWQHFKVRT